MHLSGPLTERTGREIAAQLKRIADALEGKRGSDGTVDVRVSEILITEEAPADGSGSILSVYRKSINGAVV